MIKDSELQGARKKAEKAVDDMPEGPMKLKAFEVAFSYCLQAESSRESEPVRASSKPVAVEASSTVAQDPTTCGDRVLYLKSDGFFDQPRGLGEIRLELAARGWIYPVTSLSGVVIGLVQKRELRRTLVTEGTKKIYRYVRP